MRPLVGPTPRTSTIGSDKSLGIRDYARHCETDVGQTPFLLARAPALGCRRPVGSQRSIIVTYETIRQWCLTFGPGYARTFRRRRGQQGDTWHLDEFFVTLNGRQQYLWRAVDEDGDVLDILVQSRRNRRAAVRFFRKLLKRQGGVPGETRSMRARGPALGVKNRADKCDRDSDSQCTGLRDRRRHYNTGVAAPLRVFIWPGSKVLIRDLAGLCGISGMPDSRAHND